MTSPGYLIHISVLALVVGLAGPAPDAAAQSNRAWGRVSFFTSASRASAADDVDAPRLSSTEFVTTFTYRSAETRDQALEFGVDSRLAGYSADDREPRVSLYEAWAGVRLLDGRLRVRGGHLWLSELGGIGAIAGGEVEYARPAGNGTLRFAGFGGLEPKTYEAGYFEDVRRYGGFVAFDGQRAMRSVLGYVLVKNADATERSVVTTTNSLPLGSRTFVYQAAEFDLQGPAGQGSGGLTYLLANARVTAGPKVDLQASYHRGRSIDARTITHDQINGRPIAPKALEGYLFESLSGRVTVEVIRGVRLFAGYGHDRGNEDSEPADRLTLGGWAGNVAGSGVDLSGTFYRIERGDGSGYDSWYLSLGRNITSRVYVSGDYTSSLAVVRFMGTDGIVVEDRPETDRLSGTAVIHVTRLISLLLTAEHTTDPVVSDTRLLAGITYRLP